MNSSYIRQLAGAHARAFIRGTISLFEIQNWADRIAEEAKPVNRATAAALYVLHLGSFLPDSAESELRAYLVSYLDR